MKQPIRGNAFTEQLTGFIAAGELNRTERALCWVQPSNATTSSAVFDVALAVAELLEAAFLTNPDGAMPRQVVVVSRERTYVAAVSATSILVVLLNDVRRLAHTLGLLREEDRKSVV